MENLTEILVPTCIVLSHKDSFFSSRVEKFKVAITLRIQIMIVPPPSFRKGGWVNIDQCIVDDYCVKHLPFLWHEEEG